MDMESFDHLEEEISRSLDDRWSGEELYNHIKFGEWNIVVEKYRNDYDLFCIHKLNKLGETALHLAVSHGPENIVEDLVQIISQKGSIEEVLTKENNEGNNPLHLAAATGSLRKCICIAEAHPQLGKERNKKGERPLFLAALHGKTDIFVCLQFICGEHLGSSYYRRNNGETILHCAIKRECWDLAYHILLQHENLVTFVDEHGMLTLNLLADKPAAFRSGCHLGWWNEIMYHCIPADDVPKSIDPEQMIKRCKGKLSPHFPENYKTCVDFYRLLEKMALNVFTKGKAPSKGRKADVENGSNDSKHQGSQAKSEGLIQRYSRACYDIAIYVYTAILVIVGVGSDELKKIKEKHVLSLRVLKCTIEALPKDYYNFAGKGQNPELRKPTVDKVNDKDIDSSSKDKFSMAIHDDKDEGKNIALLVVENRQPQIHQLLLKRELLTETMLQKLDKDGNNALHLAAKLWISSSSKEDDLKKKKETSILPAARNGIMEIVEEILNKYSVSIHDETDEGKNIALLAVENRQPQIYQLLLKKGLLTETML